MQVTIIFKSHKVWVRGKEVDRLRKPLCIDGHIKFIDTDRHTPIIVVEHANNGATTTYSLDEIHSMECI